MDKSLTFESLLGELSANLVTLSLESIDPAIESSMKKLVDFFNVDRCHLGTLSEDQSEIVVSYFYTRPGLNIPQTSDVGIGHVMDAAIITEDEGADKTKWVNVSQNLLKLSKREYINYPKVKYGYCNGREPIDYVERIMKRYQIYSKLKPIN